MNPAIQAPALAIGTPPNRAVGVRRIDFVSDPPPDANIIRRFRQPRRCAAMERMQDGPVDSGDLVITLVPSGAGAEDAEWEHGWAEDRPTSPLAITVGGQKIRWRPGRALVQGAAAGFEHSIEALIDFTFYEGELRRLEEALEGREDQAQADIARAYSIRYHDRKDWPRIVKTAENFCRMRADYARLAPNLLVVSRDRHGDARRILLKLVEEGDIASRLEVFSDRLEACEDLYEGAVDRIAEFRWYREGHWLEAGIILLLSLELAILAVEAYLPHLR